MPSPPYDSHPPATGRWLFSSLKSNWNSAQEEYCLTRAANGQFVTRCSYQSVNLPDKDGSALETAGVPGIRNSFK